MSDNEKWTPGPWVVIDSDTVIGPRGNVVAECCGYSTMADDPAQVKQGGREANARLISSAPALYAALREIRDLTRGRSVTERRIYAIARAALASARGES